MHISTIALTKAGQMITLAADVTFRGKKKERAYLSLNKSYHSMIVADASPFLAAVLLPCMKTGEPIHIEGEVSQDLLINTKKIMELVASWNIGLSPISIAADSVSTEKNRPTATASFFTGGVDSFYTYLKHKQTKKPINHLIIVHGFDIPLTNESFFKQVAKTVQEVAKKEKITPVFLKTNLGEIIERKLVWDFAHGGALAAVAYFLRGGLQQLYIPGAVRDDQLFPYGTHPDLDKLWSTKTMNVQSDGGEYDRIQKVMSSIAHSPFALKYVRVCTQNIKGKYNCSRCYKCLITMIYLSCADSLHKAGTFTKKNNLNHVKKMYYDYQLKYNIQGEMALAILQEQNREPALQKAIAYSLEQSKKTKLLKRIAKQIATWDQRYNDRRLYQLVFRLNANNDRNFAFKLLFNRGILK